MKQGIKKLICTLVALVFCMMTMPFFVSADEKLTVNGKEVSKGDIVTYEYYVGGIEDPVAAAGCYIEYDPEFLEYVDDSIGFDVFNNAMFSMNDGVIYYSAVNAISGYDMKSEKLVVSISFKVLDTAKGSTNITHTFDEFFTIKDQSTDLTADDYNDSDTLKVNGYEGTNTSPYLGTDADEMQEYLATGSYSIDTLLEGNANSDADNSADSSKSSTSSTNTDSKNESKTSESSASSNVSSSKSDASSVVSENESSVSSSEASQNVISDNAGDTAEGTASENLTVQSTLSESNQASSEIESEEKGGNAVIAVICILFVIVLIGAAFYFIKSKDIKK